MGLGNVAGGFFGAMPAGGGTTQTAVNRKAGARTQVAELVTAAAAVATLLLLAPVIALMPQAALAAVVVAYSLDLIKPAEFGEIRRVRRIEFRWARDRIRRRRAARDAQGDPRRGDRVAPRARAAGLQSARLRAGPQARHARLPCALEGAPGRRDLAGPADPAHRRAALLRQRAARRRQDAAAHRPGEAVGRAARLQRRVRHRVHGGQDARSRGKRSCARRASRSGWRRSTPKRWRSCSARRSARRWAGSGCSSTWMRRSPGTSSSGPRAQPIQLSILREGETVKAKKKGNGKATAGNAAPRRS